VQTCHIIVHECCSSLACDAVSDDVMVLPQELSPVGVVVQVVDGHDVIPELNGVGSSVAADSTLELTCALHPHIKQRIQRG
jgi:hypothetical protein